MNRYFKIVLAIEILMFILALTVLVRPMYSCILEPEDYSYGIEDEEEKTIEHIITDAVDLRPGSYYVKLHYNGASSEDTYTLSSEYNTYPVIATHTGWGLDAGEDITTDLSFISCLKVDGLYVDFARNRNSKLEVMGVEIIENRDFKYIFMFLVVCISVILDIFILWYVRVDRDKRIISIAIIALTLFSSAPLLGYYITYGHDLEFHLNRLGAIYRSARHQFPVRMPGFWNNGYGYAVSVFYNDLFLYIPALLRIIGFSLQNCYKIYVVLVNLATCCISFYSFNKLGRSWKRAMMITCMYVLSPYRLLCLYTRAAVGEYTALTFYPLIAYGLYRIYTEEGTSDGKSLKERVIKETIVIMPMLIGVSGIVSCHVLSCVVAGIFIALTCLILWKRTFTMRCIRRLFTTAASALLINAWYIVPFLDYYRDEYGFSKPGEHWEFGAKGAYLWQLLTLFPNGNSDAKSFSIDQDYYINNEMSFALGLHFVFVIIAVIVLSVHDGKLLKQNRLLRMSTGYAIVTASMVCYLFPWDFIQQLSHIFDKLLEQIQFPWRFLSWFTLFTSISALLLLEYINNNLSKYYIPTVVTLLLVMLISAGYYLDTYMQQSSLIDYHSEGELDSTNMGGPKCMYLPAGADKGIFSELTDAVYPGENVNVSSAVRDKDAVIFECRNDSPQSGYVDVSLLCYRYYHAVDQATNTELPISMNENKCIRVTVPDNYEGTIRVKFAEPVMWRISEAISFVCFSGLLILICYNWVVRRKGSA